MQWLHWISWKLLDLYLHFNMKRIKKKKWNQHFCYVDDIIEIEDKIQYDYEAAVKIKQLLLQICNII